MVSLDVHRWSTPGLGSVNTFWFDTGEGVIVIDAQRELSKARQIKAEIDESGATIVAVFLTHPHPDHFGGLGVFTPENSGIPLYGSRQTRDSIAEDRFGLVKASHEVVKDDFPAEVRLPDRFLSDGEQLTIGTVRIVAYELGAGEAECMTALHLPDHGVLFCGDAIQHDMTAFLLEGRSAAWLAQLDALAARFPGLQILYPGHGEPGPPEELVRRQQAYLRDFRSLVEAEMHAGELAPGADQRIAARMDERYPGYQPVAAIPDLLKQDVAPVAKELGAAQ